MALINIKHLYDVQILRPPPPQPLVTKHHILSTPPPPLGANAPLADIVKISFLSSLGPLSPT